MFKVSLLPISSVCHVICTILLISLSVDTVSPEVSGCVPLSRPHLQYTSSMPVCKGYFHAPQQERVLKIVDLVPVQEITFVVTLVMSLLNAVS